MKYGLSITAIALFCLTTKVLAAGDAKAGKDGYTKACAACHLPDGAPKEAIAKMMKVEMRHLGSKEVQSKSNAELQKDITEGVGKMKGIKSLTDKQLGDLTSYLRTLAK
jgi:mono/diheme cytochrome c family protein